RVDPRRDQHASPSGGFWMAQGAACILALALALATRQFPPFFAALLLMVALFEYPAARGHDRPVRLLVALAADAALSSQLFIYSGSQASRTDYPNLGIWALVAPSCLLFLICAGGIVAKTVIRRQPISAFDAVQCLLSLLLLFFSVWFFAPGLGALLLGLVFLGLSAACYALAFLRFRRDSHPRNFRIFAVWSAGLFLAGTLWLLPGPVAAVCLGLAALLAIVLGVRLECLALDFHGVLYLSAAAVISGLPEYVLSALVGSFPVTPGWSVVAVAACALACYAAGKERVGEDWQHQVLHLVPALLAACAAAALMAGGIVRLVALSFPPDTYHVAFIRTLTVCALALALGFGGARWHRLEMTRIAYAALVLEPVKLVLEDLRNGRMSFIAASFFLFAVTLIVFPRLVRWGRGA
ncbi:MAG TPA: hypothetical protein VMV57_05130, partial [Terracidiphilus sp.]|nr:hypothetical protein [Terracidiphilus sp.]